MSRARYVLILLGLGMFTLSASALGGGIGVATNAEPLNHSFIPKPYLVYRPGISGEYRYRDLEFLLDADSNNPRQPRHIWQYPLPNAEQPLESGVF
jgi:hypothetical protein